MRYVMTAVAIGALAVLAACGTNEPERTSGGAAAGAATGAGIGALAGPPGVVVGALVGGGAGAATGAATSPSQVNLGKPPWTNPQTRIPGTGGPSSSRPVRAARLDSSQNAAVDRLNDQSLQAAEQGQSFSPSGVNAR
jgi:phage tail tape-measure protein